MAKTIISQKINFLSRFLNVCFIFQCFFACAQLSYIYSKLVNMCAILSHICTLLCYISKSSSGLRISFKLRMLTYVYISMVQLLLCPNSSCIYLISTPLSNKCVAKLWRKVMIFNNSSDIFFEKFLYASTASLSNKPNYSDITTDYQYINVHILVIFRVFRQSYG
jgi:hypothetical protein